MEEYPAKVECPKCGIDCQFTPRPDTNHFGSIRCSEHGFLWIAKPDDMRRKKRKTNANLINKLPEHMRDFCWKCRRYKEDLALLKPVLVLEVHHIIAVEEGGTDTPSNLALYCSECHAEIHRKREAVQRYGLIHSFYKENFSRAVSPGI